MNNRYNPNFKQDNMNFIPKNSFGVLGNDGFTYLAPSHLYDISPDLNITSETLIKPTITRDTKMHCNNYQKPIVKHNNIRDDVMSEEVFEDPLFIDSIDRNIQVFKNPFKFKVSFNPNSNSTAPYINEVIKNLRYIRLEIAILPRYYQLKKTTLSQTGSIFTTIDGKINSSSTDSYINSLIGTNETVGSDIITYVNIEYTRSESTSLLTNWTIEFILNGEISPLYSYTNNITSVIYINYQYNTDIDLAQERYIIMNIDELDNINDRATNNNIMKSFAVLYRDHVNNNFVQCNTKDVIKTWSYSNLKNIQSLTISFRDSHGKILTSPFLNYNINTSNECICGINNDGEVTIDYKCACSYIRHPYYLNLQNHTLLKIGLLQPNISKKVFC
jgi:hypothetical protein